MTKTIDVDRLAELGLSDAHLEQLRTLLAGGTVPDLSGLAASLVARFDEIDHGNDATPATIAAMESLADTLSYVRAKSARAEHPAEPRRAGLAAMAAARSGQHAPRPSASASGQVNVRLETPGGSRLRDGAELATELARRLVRLDHGPGTTRTVVASLIADYPADRKITNDEMVSSALVAAAVEPASLVAAGGLCGPVAAAYGIVGLGTVARPVRDALVPFAADRGGVRFRPPITLADVAAGIGGWTSATDAAPGVAVKPSVTAVCPPTIETWVDAVTRRIRMGNMMARFDVEAAAANLAVLMVAHARKAEQQLLAGIAAASTAVTAARLYGAARDLLADLELAAVAFRSRHRMDAAATLQVILPAWSRGLMRVDLTRALPGDARTSATDAEVDAHFAVRHIAVTYSPDAQVFGDQAAGALLGFPATVVFHIFAPGSFLFLDGGTLDLGIIRDSTLNNTNDVEIFSESFENVARVGVQSLAVTATVAPNGAVAGTVAP